MIEIRSWDGSPLDLSAFVTDVWRKDYAGRMVVPLWTAEYLEWQLRMEPGRDRRHLLAAYDGGSLAGVLLGATYDFRTPDAEARGLISSWLTIDPHYRERGIVRQLKEEQARRVVDEGGRVILSYRYHGTRHSLADRPRKASPDSADLDVKPVGLWARLLNARSAARWHVSRADRWLTRIGDVTLPKLKPVASTISVRDFSSADRPACLAMARRSAADATLAIAWDDATLLHHLSGGSSAYCLVACREGGHHGGRNEGEVVGLVSYHLLPFLGRGEELVGIFDLMLLEGMSHAEQRTLINAGLSRMQHSSAILALKMQLADVPVAAMLRTGFVPRWPDSLQVLRWLSRPEKQALTGKRLVFWR